MKTCINISFPSKVRFRKKVHSQASDHAWFFLNLLSKRPHEKKRKKGKKLMLNCFKYCLICERASPLDYLVESENCCKMRIFLQSSVPLQPHTGGSLLKCRRRRLAVRLSGNRGGAP